MTDKILIIDSHTQWALKVQSELVEFGHVGEIIGLEQTTLDKNRYKDFACITVDLSMENTNPIEYIQFFSLHYPDTIIIALMHGNNILGPQQLTKDDLFKIGVDQVIDNNLMANQLVSIINNIQGVIEIPPDDEEDKTNTPLDYSEGPKQYLPDSDFTPIDLRFFTAKKHLILDIFIRLGNDHYIKVFNRGSPVNKHKIKEIIDAKGKDKFYFLTSERLRYIKVCNDITFRLYANSTKPRPIHKIQVANNVIGNFIKETFVKGLQEDTVRLGNEICENIYALITTEPQFAGFIKALEKVDAKSLDHAFLVTFLSSMVATQFDFESEMSQKTLGLACLFHDIGKSKLPPKVATMPTILLTSEELKLYKEHPRIGTEMILGHKFLNPTICQLVMQHHEACDGSGFPKGLYGPEIHKMSKIIFFADQIAHIMVEKNISAIDGVKLLLEDKGFILKINPEIIKKFANICKNKKKLSA